jgi:hypothetical protein
LSTTFFSVGGGDLAAESAALAHLDEGGDVGVPGVSCTLALAAPRSAATWYRRITASTLAAYPDRSNRTKVSSPISLSARNSSDALPPIAPETAETMT